MEAQYVIAEVGGQNVGPRFLAVKQLSLDETVGFVSMISPFPVSTGADSCDRFVVDALVPTKNRRPCEAFSTHLTGIGLFT